jgi:two-component system nitrogen regulation response regulator GlnG
LQTRLLRVLSDGHYYRVGGVSPIKADVRVIAATHQNLEERVRQSQFREDLFHRLNVIRLRLPALRERREDIPLLAQFFLKKSALSLSVEPKRLSAEALQLLTQLPFPGNVRQLENLCHWLTVMAPAQIVEAHDLPGDLRESAPAETSLTASTGSFVSQSTHSTVNVPQTAVDRGRTGLDEATGSGHKLWTESLSLSVDQLLQTNQAEVMDQLSREFETVLIRAALRHTHGRRIEAAQKLGIGRNTITRKIQELGLDTE